MRAPWNRQRAVASVSHVHPRLAGVLRSLRMPLVQVLSVLPQVLVVATVFQLLSSLSAVAVPKLAGQLVDVAIKSDQTPVPEAQQKQQLISAPLWRAAKRHLPAEARTRAQASASPTPSMAAVARERGTAGPCCCSATSFAQGC